MERKIGDTFEFEGRKLQVKESASNGCDGCFFYMKCSSITMGLSGECEVDARDDGKDVVFVEVQEQPQKTEEIKERKVGEVFEYEGHKLKVVADTDGRKCPKCFFYSRDCSLIRDVTGYCLKEKRIDRKGVTFVEVKDEQPQELNLCEVLKYCPEGETFWSPLFGDVKLYDIDQEAKTVDVTVESGATWVINANGTTTVNEVTSPEVMLYPSREQRDWTKVKYEPRKERFDPKTLKAYDKVLVRNVSTDKWGCSLFSNINAGTVNKYHCVGLYYKFCIPYNDDTKHLVGTTDEAPVFYRYWED